MSKASKKAVKDNYNERIKTCTIKIKTSDSKEEIVRAISPTYPSCVVSMPLMPGAGLRRGAKWELDWCKELSMWLSRGQDKYWVNRYAGSGGGLAEKQGLTGRSGDVQCLKPEAKWFMDQFSIELKIVKPQRLELGALLQGKSTLWNGFWEQCTKDAAIHQRYPLLVVKTDGIPAWVCGWWNDLGYLSLMGKHVPFTTWDRVVAGDPHTLFEQIRG